MVDCDQTSVEYKEMENEYGEYSHSSKTITLSSALLGGGLEESARLTAVLSHEGSHANGVNVEGLAHTNGLLTYAETVQNFGLSTDADFAGQMLGGIMDVNSWSENSGDVEYWKLAQNPETGAYGWQWDDDFDFNIGDKKITAENMKKMIETQKMFENESLLMTLGLSSPEKYTKQSEKQVILANAGKSEESLASDELFSTIMSANGYNYDAYKNFVYGTEGFADASIAAKTLTGGSLSQGSIDKMNAGLFAAQNSGLLIKNPELGLAADNLIGSGTSEDPYFPLAPSSDGIIYITGKSGYRIVDQEMYEKVGKNGANPNYPLYEFAAFKHNGYDGVGNGQIVASENGSLGLSYNEVLGINSDFIGTGNSYQVAHESPETIKDYFAQFGSGNTSLSHNNGQYLLNGINAGTQIATMGQTGMGTNVHAHMTVNGSGTQFGQIFNLNSENHESNYVFSPYAQYMTGYNTSDFYSNSDIWEHLQNYANNSSFLNYEDIQSQHYLEYEYYNYLYKLNSNILWR